MSDEYGYVFGVYGVCPVCRLHWVNVSYTVKGKSRYYVPDPILDPTHYRVYGHSPIVVNKRTVDECKLPTKPGFWPEPVLCRGTGMVPSKVLKYEGRPTFGGGSDWTVESWGEICHTYGGTYVDSLDSTQWPNWTELCD